MKKILLILINSCFTLSVNSQISYEKRIEIELKDGYTDEDIYEFGVNGFIMSSRSQTVTDNQTEWKFEKYNTNLELVQTKSVFLDDKFKLDETFVNKDLLHLFFKERKGSYSIITIGSSDLKLTQVDGLLPKKTWIEDMSILEDYAFFNATIKNAPNLYSVNWKTGEKSLIPISVNNVSPRKTSIISFQVMNSSQEVFVYTKVIVDKNKNDIHVIRLNQKGTKEESFNLTKNVDENIIDISALRLGDNKYIYTGTYSTKYTYRSEGLFFCQAENNEINFIEFYNFLDLENFLSYLSDKGRQKVEKKKKRSKKKGKELIFNYRISPHEIIELEDGYLFLGEAYYPTYRTVTYTTTSTINGMMTTTTHTSQVFDGYQYTHAILGKFDKKGVLLWDEIFEMRSTYKPFYVKRFISIAEKNDNLIKMVFSSGKKINSKSISYNGKVLQDSESEEIQTDFEGDEIKHSFSNIDYWYENYFIAFGSQTIKNNDVLTNSKKKRKVYFISKVKYEE